MSNRPYVQTIQLLGTETIGHRMSIRKYRIEGLFTKFVANYDGKDSTFLENKRQAREWLKRQSHKRVEELKAAKI